ncbi:MAG TPA: hypothetical protein VES66_03420 [Terriglobales bacterium]|nr:hypothetical protein [Terriglobales bacterium]
MARQTEIPTIFDPAANARFDLDAPPAPWVDAGWIENFVRTPATRVQPLRSGASAAVSGQFRSQLDARVEFDFQQWGKLQMAIAGGAEHMNVLATSSGAAPQPAGGQAISAVPLQPGSTATELQLAAVDLASFSIGDVVAVDTDYQQQTGYVGSGLAAAFVNNPADVGGDVNFIRRVTFNVGRVAAKSAASLTLAQPLLGGAPPNGAAVQKVVAFVDREGGSFFQEWSALFVIPEEGGGRVCFYYPRVQACAPAQEKAAVVADPLKAYALHASLVALPYGDPVDGQQVLCYRSYSPTAAAALY